MKLTGNFDNLRDDLNRFSKSIKQALIESAEEAFDLIGTISQGKYWITPGGEGVPTDAGRLTVRTGRLIRSLSPQGGSFFRDTQREQVREIQVRGKKVIGIFGTRVPYAAIHEFGGTLPAMTITPKRAKALRFEIDGRVVFAKKAEIPARTMPPRPFLKPAAKDALPRIVAIVEDKIARLL